jgi:energy-coupling factor transporter ATP-binding protein EcfA2
MVVKVYSNPFSSCWQTVTALFTSVSKEDEAIQRLSKQSLISSLSLEMQTGSDKTLALLQKAPMATLVQKTGLTEKALVSKCQAQALIIEGRKKSVVDMQVKSVFSRVFYESAQFLDHLIDTALKALGFYEIGRESRGDWDATSRLELYVTLLSYPSFIFLSLSQVTTVAIAIAATAAIVAATIAAVGIYIRNFKPCPEVLEGFTNLTSQVKKGLLEPVFGRDIEISDIVTRLQNKEGVLLLGESGVGKSELAVGIAEKIVKGEAGLLNGKKLFSINAAEIEERLPDVRETLKGYEKDVIFFIDEFHAAWKSEDKRTVDALKTFMDLFPYYMAASTFKDYKDNEIDKDPAIARRLGINEVQPLDRKRSKIVLIKMLERDASNVRLEKGTLDHLLDAPGKKGDKVRSLVTSKAILSSAIKRVDCDPSNSVKNKIASLEQKMEVVRSSYALGASDELVDLEEASAKMKKLKDKLTSQQQMQEQEQLKLAELKKVRALWTRVKEEILSVNLKEELLGEAHRNWLINSYFLMPAYEKRLDDLAGSKELKNVRTKIDKKLIDEQAN